MPVIGNLGAGASAVVVGEERRALGFAWEDGGVTRQAWYLQPNFVPLGDAGPVTLARVSTVWDHGDWVSKTAALGPGTRLAGRVTGRREPFPEDTEALHQWLDSLVPPKNAAPLDEGVHGLMVPGVPLRLVHDGTTAGHALCFVRNGWHHQLWQLDTRVRPPDLPEGFEAQPAEGTLADINKAFIQGMLRVAITTGLATQSA